MEIRTSSDVGVKIRGVFFFLGTLARGTMRTIQPPLRFARPDRAGQWIGRLVGGPVLAPVPVRIRRQPRR